MKNSYFATHVTRIMTRALMAILAVLLFLVPGILNWYSGFRVLTSQEWWAICITFYCCAAVTAPALFWTDRLLGNILKALVFTTQNVWLLRAVRWCCGIVSLLCLPAAFVYMPLFFLVIIMGFLCLMLTVVVQVMKAAVSIREENDLTI